MDRARNDMVALGSLWTTPPICAPIMCHRSQCRGLPNITHSLNVLRTILHCHHPLYEQGLKKHTAQFDPHAHSDYSAPHMCRVCPGCLSLYACEPVGVDVGSHPSPEILPRLSASTLQMCASSAFVRPVWNSAACDGLHSWQTCVCQLGILKRGIPLIQDLQTCHTSPPLWFVLAMPP
jgi:hypothetical protein